MRSSLQICESGTTLRNKSILPYLRIRSAIEHLQKFWSHDFPCFQDSICLYPWAAFCIDKKKMKWSAQGSDVRESQEIHYSTVHIFLILLHILVPAPYSIYKGSGEKNTAMLPPTSDFTIAIEAPNFSAIQLQKTRKKWSHRKSPLLFPLPSSLRPLTPKSSDRKPLQATGKQNRRHRHHPKPKQNKTKQGEKKTERERDSTKEAKAVSKKKEEDSWKNQLPMTGSTLRQTLRNGLVSISPSGDFTVFIVSKAGPKTVVVVDSIAEGGRGRGREGGENREIQ